MNSISDYIHTNILLYLFSDEDVTPIIVLDSSIVSINMNGLSYITTNKLQYLLKYERKVLYYQ